MPKRSIPGEQGRSTGKFYGLALEVTSYHVFSQARPGGGNIYPLLNGRRVKRHEEEYCCSQLCKIQSVTTEKRKWVGITEPKGTLWPVPCQGSYSQALSGRTK